MHNLGAIGTNWTWEGVLEGESEDGLVAQETVCLASQGKTNADHNLGVAGAKPTAEGDHSACIRDTKTAVCTPFVRKMKVQNTTTP